MPNDVRQLDADVVAACRSRQNRLCAWLEGAGVDAMLIGHDRDIAYLTGFIGHDTFLLITGDHSAIITDARFDEQLNPWRALPVEQSLGEVIMGTRHRLNDSVSAYCRRHSARRLGVQAERMTLAQRDGLTATCPDVTLVPTADPVAPLRMRKDAIETKRIERAAAIQVEALVAALADLTAGTAEIECAARIEYEMKRRGATGPSFTTIVASGSHSSVPHYETASSPIGAGPLLIDWGALVDGYCSDMTRTIVLGGMSDEMRRVYQIVLDAQLAAIDACAPGRRCAEIDAVARRHIEKHGYGEQFSHGLGHGLGIDVHEPPYFNVHSTDTVLEPGMVMTVEPGIYLPGVGGVRIEDDVLITENGCRVLSAAPKELDEMIFEPGGLPECWRRLQSDTTRNSDVVHAGAASDGMTRS